MTMSEIQLNLVSQYIAHIIKIFHRNSSPYSTHYVNYYTTSRTRLEIYNKYFFLDATRKWNSSENDSKKASSTCQFHRNIFQNNNSPTPKHFRAANIIPKTIKKYPFV
jgi:hypothetical protein